MGAGPAVACCWEKRLRENAELFSLYRQIRDLFSGECKGFAELKMEGHAARNAIAALNGTAQEGEMIRVARAQAPSGEQPRFVAARSASRPRL